MSMKPSYLTSIFAVALALGFACHAVEARAPEEAPASVAKPPEAPHALDEQQAREGADGWLGLVDRGQYAESWDEAGKLFRTSTSKDQWVKALEGARAPLGHSNTRSVRATEFKGELPGAPAGDYVVVHYESSFENKPTAREIVTLRKQTDRSWKVAGYFIE